MLVQPETVLTAFVFASLAGVFFGAFPAARAPRLVSVEVVRYE